MIVVDLETSGLQPYPECEILQIAAVRVNFANNTKEVVLNVIIRPKAPKREWESFWIVREGIISTEELEKGIAIEEAIVELKELLKNEQWTSYNTSFDYDRFLQYFDIKGPSFCLMKRANSVCALPSRRGGWKYPTNREAWEILFQKNLDESVNLHRADADALVSADILLELHRREEQQKLIKKGKSYKIVYRSTKGELTERVVDVIKVHKYSFRAFCHLRNEDRTFVFERIVKIELL